MEPEQIQAELLRKLYKLGVINFKTLDKLIDKLTVRLLRRQIKEEYE